jgi:hypothetical protein
LENEKRGTNEKYKKDMKAIETRMNSLMGCHGRKKRQSVPKKIDANGHGAIQKKRVEFSGRKTEFTGEEPKESNDNVKKKIFFIVHVNLTIKIRFFS